MEETLDYDRMEYLIEGSQSDLFSVAATLSNLSIGIRDHDLNYSGEKLIWEFKIQKSDKPELGKMLEYLKEEYKTVTIQLMGIDDQPMLFGRILYGRD
jgi:hypothetical protein